MVRAQAAAASLAAAFEVLTRFVTAALQPASRSPFEEEIVRLTSAVATESRPAPESPEPQLPTPMGESVWTPPQMEAAPSMESSPPLELAPFEVSQSIDPSAGEPVPVFVHEESTQIEPATDAEPPAEISSPEPNAVFTLASLPADEQELHRRAYRVAKVSMQDIKLLRPEDVRAGRENKDLCIRLRDDIEKAHKEYDRRFQAIQSHPVDYFYDWMVEILAGGNPEALGAYPYPSPVLRH
jgi:hypothetical protein